MAHGFPTMIAICQCRVARKFTWGCRPKALPKRPPRVHPQTQLEQAIVFTTTVSIQELKVELLIFEGVAQLVASCKSKRCPAFMYLGAPLGLHNPNVKSTMNKCRKDDLNLDYLILDYLIPSAQIVHFFIYY